ncbi:hypothetical protein H4R24_002070 [Coemansia sp. RSA 988]|nr:hypothetical protein H4R24_002070 [Coemansia sp. RSA 988]
MADRAYIDGPEELAELSATTSNTQFPAAISPIGSLFCSSSSTETSSTGSQVLATVQGEGIQIYSVADSKCLRSWAFPPGVRFACPAKYFTGYTGEGKTCDSYVYAALEGGDRNDTKGLDAVVWRWTDKGVVSVGLEDKIAATYTSLIFALEPGVTAAGHLLVVHKDGSLTLSGQEMQEMHHISFSVGGSVETIWYQLVEVSPSMRSYLDSRRVADWMDGDIRLALVLVRATESDGAHAYHLSLFAVDGKDASIGEVGTTQISPKHLEAQPLACAFDADTGTLAILTEAGVYMHFSLSPGNSALDDAIVLEHSKGVELCGFVSCSTQGAQDSPLARNLLTQSQLAMASLTERYVAIAGTHSVVSHASTGPYESVLTIWDLQYGCLHVEKSLGVATTWLQGTSKKEALPRLTYQIQPLSPRLDNSDTARDQITFGITVAHTADPHASFGVASATNGARSRRGTRKRGGSAAWSVKTFVASAFLPPVSLLASLRLQNNAKYYVDLAKQPTQTHKVHSANMLLHEEQEQGLGVLRSGYEAIVDGTTSSGTQTARDAAADAFQQIARRREDTQADENEVLLALANMSGAIDSDQYTQLFMEHIGASTASGDALDSNDSATWISAHLMTTVMRRCFAEPLGVSRSSQLPLFAPRVIEFMLSSCGLCNSHAPAPGLLQHLIARVDKRAADLSSDPAWRLVNIALHRCPDLPEQQVVEVLQFQLTHYQEHVDHLFNPLQTEDEGEGAMTSRVASDVMRTVAAIASITGSDDLLRLALANLSLNYAACVLRLLVIWMRAWAEMGASVELAASAGFVPTRGLPDAEWGTDAAVLEVGPIQEAIARASHKLPPLHDNAPTVDASLTLFKAPQEPSAEVDPGTSIVRVFTRKWAPALELPIVLTGAPELGQVTELATLILDAHLSNILLSPEFSALVAQLADASDRALSVSDQLKQLRIGLLPFHMAWESQQQKRVSEDLAQQKQTLGLDEVVLLNGSTRSQAERQREAQPNAKCAQGTGPAGTYWERIQKLEKYRVEVMHW